MGMIPRLAVRPRRRDADPGLPVVPRLVSGASRGRPHLVVGARSVKARSQGAGTFSLIRCHSSDGRCGMSMQAARLFRLDGEAAGLPRGSCRARSLGRACKRAISPRRHAPRGRDM